MAKPTNISFENILPWGTTGGDTGLSARLKLKRNFDKIKAWIDALDLSPDEQQLIALIEKVGKELFLSRTSDDTAEGLITFNQVATLVGGLLLGEKGEHSLSSDGTALLSKVIFDTLLGSQGAIKGFLDGKGITMDSASGLIQADALEVRGWMRLMLLIINRLQLMDSDYSFTEGGTIETVTDNGDGTLILLMHKQHDGDTTPFAEGDILFAKINDLQAHGTYYTSWMRVTTVDTGENILTVQLYPGNEVPGGVNFAPTDMANVTRWGNVTNTERQQAWVLSTTDKRLSFLWHVDKPIIEDENYALVLGMIPDLKNLPHGENGEPLWNTQLPSIYTNTLFYGQQFGITYPARVVKEDRGLWSDTPQWELADGTTASEPYHCRGIREWEYRQLRAEATWSAQSDEWIRQQMLGVWKCDLETSRAWLNGVLWECLKEGTMQMPGYGCSDWTPISGGTVKLQIELELGDWMAIGEENAMTCTVVFGEGEDITDTVDVWTIERESGDAASDAVWNATARAQAFDGTFVLRYTTDPATNDLGDDVPTKFIVRAKKGTVELTRGEVVV